MKKYFEIEAETIQLNMADNDVDVVDGPDLEAPDPVAAAIAAFNAAVVAHATSAAAAERASAAHAHAIRSHAVARAAAADADSAVTATHGNAPVAVFHQAVAAAAADAALAVATRCDVVAADAVTAAAAADVIADIAAADAADVDVAAAAHAADVDPAAAAYAAAWYAAYDARVAADAAADAVAANLSEKWQKFLKSRSDIGMLTIMYMHGQERGCHECWMIYLLILVLAAQLMLPILLVVYARYTYEIHDFCPNFADEVSRVLAFAIACIYQVRIVFMLGSKTSEPFAEIKRGRDSVWLSWALSLDGFMNTTYELFVYGMNLFIVFVTPDPLEMVLNALAFESILKLDDVVKAKYISIHAKYHDTIIKEYDATFDFTSEATTAAYTTCNVLNYFVPAVIVTYILSPFTMIYLPLCKPGKT